jgi:hypothetical protein
VGRYNLVAEIRFLTWSESYLRKTGSVFKHRAFSKTQTPSDPSLITICYGRQPFNDNGMLL